MHASRGRGERGQHERRGGCAPNGCTEAEIDADARQWITRVRRSGLESRFLHCRRGGQHLPEPARATRMRRARQPLQRRGAERPPPAGIPNLTNTIAVENTTTSDPATGRSSRSASPRRLSGAGRSPPSATTSLLLGTRRAAGARQGRNVECRPTGRRRGGDGLGARPDAHRRRGGRAPDAHRPPRGRHRRQRSALRHRPGRAGARLPRGRAGRRQRGHRPREAAMLDVADANGAADPGNNSSTRRTSRRSATRSWPRSRDGVVDLDYGRYDLNGDGYTGGGRDRIDLDARTKVGSDLQPAPRRARPRDRLTTRTRCATSTCSATRPTGRCTPAISLPATPSTSSTACRRWRSWSTQRSRRTLQPGGSAHAADPRPPHRPDRPDREPAARRSPRLQCRRAAASARSPGRPARTARSPPPGASGRAATSRSRSSPARATAAPSSTGSRSRPRGAPGP